MTNLLIPSVVTIILSIGIIASFPESRYPASSLSNSRSVNPGLKNNVIGGSLIYAASTGPEVTSMTITKNEIIDNTLKGERSAMKKRSRSSRSKDDFERTKRDPAPGPDTGTRSLYHRISGCVRSGMGNQYLVDNNARCAIMAWFRVFKIREKAQCKNCNPLFYCVANAEVHGQCGHHHHGREAAAAISDCPELRLTSAESTVEVLDEASVRGRSSGTNGCNNFYLCSAGCRYSSFNDTCSATCH